MTGKLKTKAKQLKTQVLAVYLAGKHKDTPLGAKILAVIVTAYALSPIDLIPDFIPILGYLDDLILLPLGMYLVLKMIPEDIMEQCRTEAAAMEDKPKNYAAALVILLIWISIITVIVLEIIEVI